MSEDVSEDVRKYVSEAAEQKPHEREEYLSCQCSWLGHSIRAVVFQWEDDSEPELVLDFCLNASTSFWRRVKLAIGYVFGRTGQAEFDSWLMKPEDARRMALLLGHYMMRLHCYKQRREKAE